MGNVIVRDDAIERSAFNKAFTRWLVASESCFVRDVLRESKEALWQKWLQLSEDCDNKTGLYKP